MNIHNIVYKGIRAISFISILGTLSIGFILPISFIQTLVINPIILILLMLIFVISNEKLKSAKKLAAIVPLPDNSKCTPDIVNKAA